MRYRLERQGHEVFEASDGTAAIREVDRQEPDLVISDILMLNCDGIEVIVALRKKHPDLKVLAISWAEIKSSCKAHGLLELRGFYASRSRWTS